MVVIITVKEALLKSNTLDPDAAAWFSFFATFNKSSDRNAGDVMVLTDAIPKCWRMAHPQIGSTPVTSQVSLP